MRSTLNDTIKSINILLIKLSNLRVHLIFILSITILFLSRIKSIKEIEQLKCFF